MIGHLPKGVVEEGVAEEVVVVRQLLPPPALPLALLPGLQLDVQPQHSSLNHNSTSRNEKDIDK
jgi:hypothetical protein